MRQLCENGMYVFYQTENAQMLLGDTFELLQKLRPESVDVIFADPPYFLSNNGITCRSGKMVSVRNTSLTAISSRLCKERLFIYSTFEAKNRTFVPLLTAKIRKS